MRTGRNFHCAGPNVRHHFSPILSKYFLLPTSRVFNVCRVNYLCANVRTVSVKLLLVLETGERLASI